MIERFENYEVLKRPDGSPFELGRGGMGVTYKAYDTDLHCEVALKVIKPDLLAAAGTQERFLREARSAARLRHPNIASVFRLGKTADDSLFYAMEFCAGPTLAQAIHERGPFPAVNALHIAWQVCKALVLAEQHQLLHRDLKPSNLILTERPDEGLVVKVIDFGLAKCVDEHQQSQVSLATGGFVGTAHFASPEQLEGMPLDSRSDLYSLGACIWYMLTGGPVFHGPLARVMSQTLHDEPPWEKLEGQEPLAVEICRHFLAKDREQRPPSAAAARVELEQALHVLSDAIADPDEESPTIIDGSHAGATPGNYRSGYGLLPTSHPGQARPQPSYLVPDPSAGRAPSTPPRMPSSANPPSAVPASATGGAPAPSSSEYSSVPWPPSPRWGLWLTIIGVLGLLGLAGIAAGGWYMFSQWEKRDRSASTPPALSTPVPIEAAEPEPEAPRATPAPTPRLTPFPTPRPLTPATPRPSTPVATPPRSFSFDSPTPWPGENDHLSRLQYLPMSAVRTWTDEHIRSAINEIFARRGYVFNDAELMRSLTELPWYRPRPGVSRDQIESELTTLERANLQTLTLVRDVRSGAKTLPGVRGKGAPKKKANDGKANR